MNNFIVKFYKLINDIYAQIGIVIVIIFLILIIFQSYLPSPFEQNLDNRLSKIGENGHVLGSDQFGRDQLSRLIYGAKISITVGFLSSIITLIIGVLIGSIAGYYGGKTDAFLMRITDMIMGFPSLLLLIALSSAMSPGINTVIISIGLTSWTGVARTIRSQVFTIKTEEYISAAKSLGYSNIKILINHILPNCFGLIMISFTLSISGAIMAEASLSFLGLGVQPPVPSWGVMISEGKDFFRVAPRLSLLPGLTTILAVLSINLLGEALRDLLEP